MVAPSSAIARYDLGATIEEFDLMANVAGFIGTRVLRPMIVSAQAGNVPKVPDNQLSTIVETTRGPRGEYRRDDWEFGQLGWNAQERGREALLDDATLKVYSGIIDAEAISVKRIAHQILSKAEVEIAAAVNDTSVWTGATLTTALTTPWSTHASSTPIDDIAAVKEKGVALGVKYNALVCNDRQWWHLMQSAQLLARMSSNERKTDNTMRSALSELLQLKYIIVAGEEGGGLKNTANQGQADPVYSRIWPTDTCMVCKVAVSDDPMEVCIGRTILWNEDGGGAAAGTGEGLALTTEEYREEGVRSGVIRSRTWYGIKIMFPKCGQMLTNVAAS